MTTGKPPPAQAGDPERLGLAAGDEASVWRQLMASEDALPSASAMSRMRAGLQAQLGPGAVASRSSPEAAPREAAGQGAPVAKPAGVGKLVGVAAVAALVGVGLVMGGELLDESPRVPRRLSAIVVRSPEPAAPPTAPAAGPATEMAGSAPGATLGSGALGDGVDARPTRATDAPRRAERVRTTRTPSKTPGGELALLENAQQALRGRPAHALALAKQHRREFPRGQFASEREMIAVEALLLLDRPGEARRRATHFERQYPRSSHLPRLRRMLP